MARLFPAPFVTAYPVLLVWWTTDAGLPGWWGPLVAVAWLAAVVAGELVPRR